MSEPVPEAYALGALEARITEHDRRLERINGSQERTAVELREIKLGLQRLGDQAEAREKRYDDQTEAKDATVIATAKALKDADRQRWSPFNRLALIVAGIGGVISIAISIYLAYKSQSPIPQKP